MTREVPEEMIPDGWNIIADYPVCPGCDREFDQAQLEYRAVEYLGETWHLECAYEDSDHVVKADNEWKCPNCRTRTDWYNRITDQVRCHCCRQPFSPDGGATHR